MQNAAPVEFPRYRDFGRIIADTFQFLRQNWKPLFRALAVICLPVGILSGFLMGKSMGDLQQLSIQAQTDPSAAAAMGNSMLPMFLGYFLMLVMIIMLIAVVYEYMRAYHLGEHHGITTADIWRRSFRQSGNYLALTIITAILVTLSTFVFIIPGIYVFVALTFVYMAHAIERTGIGGSLSRSYRLIQDRWWETFGLMIVVVLIQWLISYALMMPSMILSFVIGLTSTRNSMETGGAPDLGWLSIAMSVLTMLNMLIIFLTYPIMSVAMGLKYFSLVEEKEGLGIRQRIQMFEQA